MNTKELSEYMFQYEWSDESTGTYMCFDRVVDCPDVFGVSGTATVVLGTHDPDNESPETMFGVSFSVTDPSAKGEWVVSFNRDFPGRDFFVSVIMKDLSDPSVWARLRADLEKNRVWFKNFFGEDK